MSVTIRNGINIQQLKEELVTQLRSKLESELEITAGEIVARTQSGKEITGSSFKPYSKGYAKYKAKKGRSTSVDLTFTGKMLGAITSRVYEQGKNLIGKIFFSSSDEAKKAGYNQQDRKFFGLSTAQKQAITKALDVNFK